MATIITKRGNGVPTAANLVEGEKGIDLLTGRVYTLSGGVVIECGQDPHDIDFHTDVDTTTTAPNDGDILTYDGAINTWVPEASAGVSSGIGMPVIYSPTGSVLNSLEPPMTFISTPAVITNGEVHVSSEWIVYDDINLTNPVFQSGVVSGTEKTNYGGVTGLAGSTTHYIVVRYITNFGTLSPFSRPLRFTTGAATLRIYEHGVSAVPTISSSNPASIIFEGGWQFNWFVSFWGGGGPSDPYTSENRITVDPTTQTWLPPSFQVPQNNDQILYRKAYSTVSSGFPTPGNFAEWYWKFDVNGTLSNPNFDPSLAKYIDKNDANFDPALGFKTSLWNWHNMARVPANYSTWSELQNASGGNLTHRYANTRGTYADDIVDLATESGEITSGYNSTTGMILTNAQWDWHIGSPSRINNPVANNGGGDEAWYYALKKLEVILP